MEKNEKRIRHILCIFPAVNIVLMLALTFIERYWRHGQKDMTWPVSEVIGFFAGVGVWYILIALVLMLVIEFISKRFFCVREALRVIVGGIFFYNMMVHIVPVNDLYSFLAPFVIIAILMLVLPLPLYIIMMNREKKKELQNIIDRIQSDDDKHRNVLTDIDDD